MSAASGGSSHKRRRKHSKKSGRHTREKEEKMKKEKKEKKERKRKSKSKEKRKKQRRRDSSSNSDSPDADADAGTGPAAAIATDPILSTTPAGAVTGAARIGTGAARMARPAATARQGPARKLTAADIAAARRGVTQQAKSRPVAKMMTKAEYDEQQSVVRKVFDEDTGRVRLVKGDGEIIEEIVSRDRQKEINRQATYADGISFQRGASKQGYQSKANRDSETYR